MQPVKIHKEKNQQIQPLFKGENNGLNLDFELCNFAELNKNF